MNKKNVVNHFINADNSQNKFQYLLGYYFGMFSIIENIENAPIITPTLPTRIAKIKKFFCLSMDF